MRFSSFIVLSLLTSPNFVAKSLGCTVTNLDGDYITNLVTVNDAVECNEASNCSGAKITACDNVICSGNKSCLGATIESFQSLVCLGELSCSEATIASESGASLDCDGPGACLKVSVDMPSGVMNCKGVMACAALAKLNIGSIHCKNGKKSCDLSHVHSNLLVDCGLGDNVPGEKCFEKGKRSSTGAAPREKVAETPSQSKGMEKDEGPGHDFGESPPDQSEEGSPGQEKKNDSNIPRGGQGKNIKTNAEDEEGTRRYLRTDGDTSLGQTAVSIHSKEDGRHLNQCSYAFSSGCVDYGANGGAW
jgi:hypothetical protein